MEHSRNPNRNPAEVSTAEYFEGQEIPPIEIIVAFGKHVLESDMPQLDDLFPMADIVVLEAFGHTPLHEIVDNEISQGSLTGRALHLYQKVAFALNPLLLRLQRLGIPVPALESPGYAKKINNLLIGSRKPVAFIDVPYGSDLYHQIEDLDHGIVEGEAILRDLPFEQALEGLKLYAQKFGNLEVQREDRMAANLNKNIADVIADHPKLKSQQKIVVLLVLGEAHTGIFHLLKQRGEVIQRHFEGPQTIFPPGSALKRTVMFGKEVSDDLIARTLIALIAAPVLGKYKPVPDGAWNEAAKNFWKLVNTLSFEECRSLFELWRNDPTQFEAIVRDKLSVTPRGIEPRFAP